MRADSKREMFKIRGYVNNQLTYEGIEYIDPSMERVVKYCGCFPKNTIVWGEIIVSNIMIQQQ